MTFYTSFDNTRTSAPLRIHLVHPSSFVVHFSFLLVAQYRVHFLQRLNCLTRLFDGFLSKTSTRIDGFFISLRVGESSFSSLTWRINLSDTRCAHPRRRTPPTMKTRRRPRPWLRLLLLLFPIRTLARSRRLFFTQERARFECVVAMGHQKKREGFLNFLSGV